MRRLTFKLCGEAVPVYVVTEPDDLTAFYDWLAEPRRALAVDTETTGVDIYARDFRLRLIQFGDEHAAWVLPVETMPRLREHASEALNMDHRLVLHNAAFDLHVLDRAGVTPMDELWPKVVDTQILSHLIDPRASHEGSIGHGLKELSTVWIDGNAPDSQRAMKDEFKKLKCKISDGFARIDIDNPEYLRYAGADTVLTARLLAVLEPIVQSKGWTTLARFEHELAAFIATVERRGMLLDVDYAERLKLDLLAEQEAGERDAARFGVTNVNNTRQVATALEATGAVLTERTPSGSPKVDRAVLSNLAGAGNPLAAAIVKAKRANKYRTSYVASCLALRDETDRIHPSIRPLQARTARMSVSSPPLQQLPSGEWRIRRLFVADPGQLIVSCDYAQVEMRILAVLADEPAMKAAIQSGESLHMLTGRALYGLDFDKDKDPKGYKLAKNVGFGRVYGGGANTLSRQADVSLVQAKSAMDVYDRSFPNIKRHQSWLVDRATFSGDRAVITPTGRRLPLDGDRLYAALNYEIQSTARDVMAQALLDLRDAGLGEYVLLPIHDEVLGQAPADMAQEIAERIADVMSSKDFLSSGIDLDAEPDVYGSSWAGGYGYKDPTDIGTEEED